MVFKILTYLSGLVTGFAFGVIVGERILNFILKFITTRGGLI